MAARAYNRRCLVLKKTKLAETDAIITMLADQGHQVRAVAKGVRRPGSRFGARLEPFAEVDLLLHSGRTLDIVREARTVQSNATCREDLDKTAASSVIAEFIERTTRDAAVEPRVFSLTQAAFSSLDERDARQAGLQAAAYLVKAFYMMGVGPALRECALCGAPAAGSALARFDLSAGGALCASCAASGAPPAADSAALVSWLDFLMHVTFARLEHCRSAPVRVLLDFCDSWAVEHLSVNLRSFGFLKALY